MNDFEERYRAARRNVIAVDLRRLNPMQRQAAMKTEGPLLLLAGAGSGKTTVLIQRIYTLLTYGRGSDTEDVPDWATEDDLAFLEQFPEQPDDAQFERARRLCAMDPPRPWEIIAITFTNKAAGELKERLAARLGPTGNDVWASTFHSACVRILRRYIERIGFERDFTIYDRDDSIRALKPIIEEVGLEPDGFIVRKVLHEIGRAKNDYLLPEEYAKCHILEKDVTKNRIAKIYAIYQQRLAAANALDFDDILFYTVKLLKQEPDVLEHYQNQFRYVLVDEYQDTNHIQDVLTSLLAGRRRNLCVVGDDDQSIYGFRGADPKNILTFEKRYPDAAVVRLNKNYRSTKHILGAVNAVIRKNHNGDEKRLTTDNEEGEKILIQSVSDEMEEAAFIVDDILKSVNCGRNYGDIAILYRVNAQSRALEDALAGQNIPYKIVADIKFFDRAEVKDMLSYLHVVNNRLDDLRFRRIANNPPRGIGNVTMRKAMSLAASQGLSIYEIFRNADIFPELKSAKEKLLKFADMIDELHKQSKELPLMEFYDLLCRKTGYVKALEEKGDEESARRLENVWELKSSISYFLEQSPTDATLSGFLNGTALSTGLDSVEFQSDYVTLMTVHSAKGLEFPVVYIAGMEDGVFPSVPYHSDAITPEEEAEERRLCYVAMTRAKERLILTASCQKTLYGKTKTYSPSRFLTEIPPEHCDWRGISLRDEDFISESMLWNAPRNAYAAAHYGASVEKGNSAPRAATKRDEPFKTPPVTEALRLKAGDIVEHMAFGKGIVVSVKPMAKDALLEIRFDGLGMKKLMLNSASNRMKKL